MRFWLLIVFVFGSITGEFISVEKKQNQMDNRLFAVESKLKETMSAVGAIHEEDLYINSITNSSQ